MQNNRRRDSFSGRRDSGRDFGRDSGSKEMFRATCDDCGKSCQVPFRPTSGKPVYCSDCFEDRGNTHNEGFFQRKEGRGMRDDRGGRGDRQDRENRPMADEIGMIQHKLDQVIFYLSQIAEASSKPAKKVKTVRVKKDKTTKDEE